MPYKQWRAVAGGPPRLVAGTGRGNLHASPCYHSTDNIRKAYEYDAGNWSGLYNHECDRVKPQDNTIIHIDCEQAEEAGVKFEQKCTNAVWWAERIPPVFILLIAEWSRSPETPGTSIDRPKVIWPSNIPSEDGWVPLDMVNNPHNIEALSALRYLSLEQRKSDGRVPADYDIQWSVGRFAAKSHRVPVRPNRIPADANEAREMLRIHAQATHGPTAAAAASNELGSQTQPKLPRDNRDPRVQAQQAAAAAAPATDSTERNQPSSQPDGSSGSTANASLVGPGGGPEAWEGILMPGEELICRALRVESLPLGPGPIDFAG